MLTVLALGVTLAGCGQKDAAEEYPADGGEPAAQGAVLTIGHPQDIESLDSAFAYDFDANPVVVQITEPLLSIDVDGEISPLLAESWEEVDATTYVYTIRDDVTFSDGNPMTMEDVLFSMERYGEESLASYVGWMYDNVESIEQTGDWEVTVKLSQPDATWKYVPTTTAGHIHEKAVVESLGAEYGTLNGFPIGTGPYTVESWDAGGDITLAYNENYWGATGTPDITKIIFQLIPEESTRSLAAATGQIDIDLSASVDLLDQIENSELATLLKSQKWGDNYLTFNCQVEPFNDVNARKAVVSAIDSATIQTSITRENGEMTNYIIIPESLYGADATSWNAFQASATKYEYDLEKAKEYLADSAYPDGFEFALTIDEHLWGYNFAIAIQQALDDIGITMTINKVSNDEATAQQFGDGIENGVRPYQAGIFEWVADFPDAGGMVMPLLMSDYGGEGGANSADYRNSEVDTLLNEQNTLTDAAERLETLQAALAIVAEEQPYYTIAQSNWLFAVNNRITNAADVLTAAYIWNFPVKDMELA